MNGATHCPCGTTLLNDGLSTLDHDNRCPECEGYCSPSECECRSDLAPAKSEEFAAWDRMGRPGPCELLDRLVATGVSEAAAIEVYEIRDLAGLAYRVEQAESTVCGCGRIHTETRFLALPAPAKGAYMDDGNDGCLVLRNCPCGSTRARHGTAADVDAWQLEQLASDLEYLDRCERNTRAAIADREERGAGEVAA